LAAGVGTSAIGNDPDAASFDSGFGIKFALGVVAN